LSSIRSFAPIVGSLYQVIDEFKNEGIEAHASVLIFANELEKALRAKG
jgi:hypothetical protein